MSCQASALPGTMTLTEGTRLQPRHTLGRQQLCAAKDQYRFTRGAVPSRQPPGNTCVPACALYVATSIHFSNPFCLTHSSFDLATPRAQSLQPGAPLSKQSSATFPACRRSDVPETTDPVNTNVST
eukprot:1156248-Pelagomonas_calceolata.AAC.8